MAVIQLSYCTYSTKELVVIHNETKSFNHVFIQQAIKDNNKLLCHFKIIPCEHGASTFLIVITINKESGKNYVK